MNVYVKNLKALEAKDRGLAAKVRATPDDPRVRLVKTGGRANAIELASPNGNTVVFKKQPMPSNVRRITERKQFGFSEVIILLGIGLGETLAETLAASDAGTFILLVESNLAYFKKLLEGFDVAELIGDPRVVISAGESPVDAVMHRLEEEFGVFTRSNFQVIKHGTAISCDADYYRAVDGVLARQKQMAEGNLASINRLSSVWQGNIFSNLDAILRNPGIKHLFGRMAGVPAVIVAAGPSLDKNCHWLKAARDSMVIICVDTALKTLLKNGITPHFVVALDALLHNYFHLAGAERPDYTLVVNPVTYPLILAECAGPMMITSYSEPMVRWLEQFTGDLGENLTGGSVATAAFDLAVRMGCSPVILTGQDLAFTGNRTHSGGGANDEFVYSAAGEMSGAETMHGEAINLEIPKTVEGNLGHTLKCNVKMITWRNWFEIRIAQKGVDCINATEGGAAIAGGKPMCLREVILKYGGSRRDIAGIIAAARPVRLPADMAFIRQKLAALAAKARDIKKICSMGIKEAGQLAAAAQRKGENAAVETAMRSCGDYLGAIMREAEFMGINRWRMEGTMDRIQRLRGGVKTADPGKRAFINAESFSMFFKDAYQATRELEKNIRSVHLEAGPGASEGKADAV